MANRTSSSSSPGRKPAKSQARKQQEAKRALAAASRADAKRNKRMLQVLVPIVTVIVVVGILIGVKVGTANTGKSSSTSVPAGAAVTNAVTHIPDRVYAAVGPGDATGPTKMLTGPPLREDGKPHILFVGAEWCPYCAAERWPVVAALSRFGTLTNLGRTRSSADDQAGPDTATLSFHGARYASKYLSVTLADIRDNNNKPLDRLRGKDEKVWSRIGDGYPLLDIGGKYEFAVQYDPKVLGGKSKTQAAIADAMSDPTSPIAAAVIGSANVLTAAICEVTGNEPADVCTSKGVLAAKPKLSDTQS